MTPCAFAASRAAGAAAVALAESRVPHLSALRASSEPEVCALPQSRAPQPSALPEAFRIRACTHLADEGASPSSVILIVLSTPSLQRAASGIAAASPTAAPEPAAPPPDATQLTTVGDFSPRSKPIEASSSWMRDSLAALDSALDSAAARCVLDRARRVLGSASAPAATSDSLRSTPRSKPFAERSSCKLVCLSRAARLDGVFSNRPGVLGSSATQSVGCRWWLVSTATLSSTATPSEEVLLSTCCS